MKKRIVWILGALLLVGLSAGWGLTKRASATGVKDIRLDACQMDLESEAQMRTWYEQRLAKKEREYREDLKARETTWRALYEKVKAERAGEWCWEKLQEVEDDIDREQRFCRWRLRNAGLIRYKTEKAVERLDKNLLDAGAGLLTPAEEAKLDD